MKSMKELSEVTGQPYATLQFWKRSGLLPPPVSKNGRTELFDDSTVARIQTILDFQSQGMSLENVAEVLKLKEEQAGLMSKISRLDKKIEDANEFAKTWVKGDCKREICNLLKIDPAFTSEPSCYGPLPIDENGSLVLNPTAESFATVLATEDNTPTPADVFLAISTKDKVYLARVRVVLHEQPCLIEVIQMSRKTYGHLLLCMVEQSERSLATPSDTAFTVLHEKAGRTLLEKAEASEGLLELGRKVARAMRSLDSE